MANQWNESFFYHVYPLGFCGAPRGNDHFSEPIPRLERLTDHVTEIRSLGCDALYLGPLFESTAHGYDTADYFTVDRRLGTADTLKSLIASCHDAGIRVVLDGVFNHVGREFWAFRDLRENGARSPYRDWFVGVDFSADSPYGDGFSYAGWEGHFDLVVLNRSNPEVRNHLLEAVRWMIDDLGIDGLRLDVAYLLEDSFLEELARLCRSRKSDFWLLGEMIHGDFRRIVRPEALDSATNYECYKGIYSSHNDGNYFEIAWSLNRQFGPEGIYRGLSLYNFVDNHDVDRIASTLTNPEHLPLAYALLFAMPGIPSIYYGSEIGRRGSKTDGGDHALRPAWDHGTSPDPELRSLIVTLAELRRSHVALRHGAYRQLHVDHRRLAFERATESQTVVVALNAADRRSEIPIDYPFELVNPLDPADRVAAHAPIVLPPYGWRVYARAE